LIMWKAIITWDIKPGHEQNYFAYVVREYLPGINQLGLEVTDAWITVYGNQPQVLLGAVVPSLEQARQILHSNTWEQLNHDLSSYVEDMQVKFAPHKGGFQF